MSVDVLVVNGTGSALSNINAGGDDIPAYSIGVDGDGTTVATVTGAEALTLLANDGIAVLSDGCTDAQKRMVSKVLRLGKNPGTHTTSLP